MAPFQQWETLVEWMDSEGMAEDLSHEKYREETYRLSHFDHIIEVLERWTRTHTTDELFQLAQLMRLPWAPVLSHKETLDSPQMKARKFFIVVDHPEMEGRLKYAGAPYRFSTGSPEQWKPAPLIGEHNVQVYQGELGLPEEELRRLSAMNVI
jgi:crotonobetainyl-CoA:carnitine CoA-transferase CaiB-like acyl-CoA transferase